MGIQTELNKLRPTDARWSSIEVEEPKKTIIIRQAESNL
jgi:hypothetical protein